MKKPLGKTLIFFFIYALGHNLVIAQDDLPGTQSYFQEFQSTKSAEDRFKFFFNTPNRYNQNSGFDWLDEVNVYLNNAEKLKDTVAINYYKVIQSQIFHDIGDYDKSLAISKELYVEKEPWSLETKAVLLDLMDATYSQLELYADQIDIRKEKRELGIAENIAFYDIYSNLGQHRKAMDDYILEEQKNIDDKDYLGKAIFNNNVGTYLRLDDSYPTALSYYNKAAGFIKIYLSDVTKVKSEKEIIESEVLKGIIEGNIGKCFVLLKQYEEAIPHLESSILTIKEFNKDKFSSDLIENRLAIAECYLHLGDFAKTTDYLSDGEQPRKLENIIKKNRLFASYYDKTGNYKNESIYLKRNTRIRDSIDANKTEIQDQQLATILAEDKAYTKTRIEEQKEELEKSRTAMVDKENQIQMVFISLIFTLLGFAGLVYAYLKSIKNQRLIAEQKHIIENSLVEKDSLLKEIHHRVKNNLQMVSSLLSLQTKNTRSKAAIEALEEGKSRVKAMALIHQKLYQNDDLSVIEMQGYIESLINSVQSVYKKGGHNINITIDAEGVELDIDRAIPFGLILNELVSNSFKYAFPQNDDNGKIYIHLRKMVEQEGFFEYTDNGVGLPEDTDDRANSSMGIRLMNRLVNQLQSSLNIDKTSEGVRFWFNFK
ncbi:MAG: sensor histidine kinase [Maribacter sp.]|uniref:sensor histidine kinase n=1 Tax=Maribacter sp. TaxID=1897614 RepID=UPI00329789B9